jgi:hypothetical protein
VANILRVKIRAGLSEAGRPSSRPYSSKSCSALIMPSLAKRCASRLLMKNNNRVLPLNL